MVDVLVPVFLVAGWKSQDESIENVLAVPHHHRRESGERRVTNGGGERTETDGLFSNPLLFDPLKMHPKHQKLQLRWIRQSSIYSSVVDHPTIIATNLRWPIFLTSSVNETSLYQPLHSGAINLLFDILPTVFIL